jgi:2-succinyl-5-enolpyruvyl-6-hydroxy-3-cyclohexene-1-carboxylate synthase
MNYPNINYLWSSLIVEELVRSGVEYFCIAPGSRSAPLTVAVARNPKAKHFIHYDERGLAFHALGYASAHKKPVVLICTSGTAGANFYPAIIEASKKKVPLVVLTADRPPELRATGSVQTIEQVGLYGKYVKFQFDMPCPDMKIKPEAVLTTVDQAFYQAVRNPSGVVHINCMFRDPLAPVKTGENFSAYLKSIDAWSKGRKPYTQYLTGFESIRIPETKKIAERLNAIKNGLIVVGKIGGQDRFAQDAVVAFARKLGWPVFADASSDLRLGTKDQEIIHYFDQILLSPKVTKALKFDGIIHLGGRITSKRFYEFASLLAPKEYMMVLNHPLRNDPNHQVTLRIESTVTNFCQTLVSLIKPRKPSRVLGKLIKVNRAADKAIEEFVTGTKQINEPQVARLISQHIPQGHGLFLANSMPIREMDFYGDFKGNAVSVNGNRGASGIDGLVASAAGLSVGLDKPVTLFVGDLALLHDLNSLAMLKNFQNPLTIIAINNDGGAIFSFLPIAQNEDVFEKFFGTPHGMSFEQAAGMFGLAYSKPATGKAFVGAYQNALKSSRSTIIEVVTDRNENIKIHKALQEKITHVVNKIV